MDEMGRVLLLLLAFAGLVLAPFGERAMAASPCAGTAMRGHAMAGHSDKSGTASESCCAAIVAALPDQPLPTPVPALLPHLRPAIPPQSLEGIDPSGQDPPPRD